MPDQLQNLLLQRSQPASGPVNYPKAGDPGVVDDKFMRFLGNAFGVDEQQPGDAASAAGQTAGLALPGVLGMMKKLRGLRGASAALPEAARALPEAAQGAEQALPALESLDPRISNMDMPMPTQKDKLMEMVMERRRLATEGRPMPRVPNPYRGRE